MFRNKIILIISPEPWGVNFVSKHHYASLLSNNNDVYFFNPPSEKYKLTTISSRLIVVDYPMTKGMNRLSKLIRFFAQQFLANKLMKKLSIPMPDIVWSFNPYVFQNLSVFNSKAIKIYHPVDVHYTDLEFDCVKSADVVFSTAHLILDKFKAINKPKYFINHGLADHFINPLIETDEFDFIDSYKAVKVGYVGNLRYQHLDYSTLFKTIESHQDCHFYFVGPYEDSNLNNVSSEFDTEIERLKNYTNVFLLGAKPSPKIPVFLSKMDMLWMCYKGAEKPAEMANPHKILEYLSTGKPILTHYIAEYNDLKDLVYLSDTNEKISAKFKEVVNNLKKFNADEIIEKRKSFAYSNAYVTQLKKISEKIDGIN